MPQLILFFIVSLLSVLQASAQPLNVPINQDGITNTMGKLLVGNINLEGALRQCTAQAAEQIAALQKELAEEKAKHADPAK